MAAKTTARTRTTGRTKADLERAKLTAEIRELDIKAKRLELSLIETERELAFEHASAFNRYDYSFIGEVGNTSSHHAMDTLSRWHQIAPKAQTFTITFDSPGGACIPGLALWDEILRLKSEGRKFRTVVRGYAASMGGVLLQAGDERVIGRHSYMLIHEVSSGHIGKISDMEDGLEFSKRIQSRLLAILAERSTLSVKQIANKWTRRDWWLDAEECVELGFADSIG